MRTLACATAVLLLAACGGSAARPDLQRQLEALVAGGYAPGVTAYVDGPHGSWSGAAGFANLATRERMRPDVRLRLQSVSKLWTATVVVALAHEGRLRLDDTVERWL